VAFWTPSRHPIRSSETLRGESGIGIGYRPAMRLYRPKSNPQSIPYLPMFMDVPQPLYKRLLRQRLCQVYRGRRWEKKGYISRLRRSRLYRFRPGWDVPPLPYVRPYRGGFFCRGERHKERPLQPGVRRIPCDMNEVVLFFTPAPGIGYRWPLGDVDIKAVRDLNAAMRGFREARYRSAPQG
jgi:hypothetical protein